MTSMSSQTDTSTNEENPDGQERPLVQHLLELRTRLLKSIAAIALGFLCLAVFSNDLYSFFSAPIQALLPEGSTMIATDVASPFFAPFKLTAFLAIFLAMPYVLFQVWSFIAPGLYEKEKKLAMPLFISSVLLFLSLIHI